MRNVLHLFAVILLPLPWSRVKAWSGDKGGNNFYVEPASRGIALHSFRDGLLGTSGKPSARLNHALRVQCQALGIDPPTLSLPDKSESVFTLLTNQRRQKYEANNA
ncbi:MAG: hypothetical protein ABSF95_05855 [Verrucomicrobiota bacterium]|jgi:hypothetical protein